MIIVGHKFLIFLRNCPLFGGCVLGVYDILHCFRLCQERLKTCDDAFREQLEAKQQSHDDHMIKLVAEKDREIQASQQRVCKTIQCSRYAY